MNKFKNIILIPNNNVIIFQTKRNYLLKIYNKNKSKLIKWKKINNNYRKK